MLSALLFFVMASVVLLTLYWYMQYLRYVFTGLILFSFTMCSSLLFEEFFLWRTAIEYAQLRKIKLPLLGEISEPAILGYFLGVVIAASWYLTREWYLNNLIAVLLALTFLKTSRLTQLTPGVLLLS